MVGVVRDITEERRQLLKLDQADQLQNLLSATAGVRLWRYDPRTNGSIGRRTQRARRSTMDRRRPFPATVARYLPSGRHRHDPRGHRGGGRHRPAGELRSAGSGEAGDGSTSACMCRGEPIGGGLHMVHGLSQNVTELVEAREAALQGELQSRRLVEQAPFAVALFDQDLRYSMASPRWIELFRLQGLPSWATGWMSWSKAIRRDSSASEAGAGGRGHPQQRVPAGRQPGPRLLAALGGPPLARRRRQDHRGGRLCRRHHRHFARPARVPAKQEQRLKIALGAARAAVVETDFRSGQVYSSPELIALTGYDLTDTPVGDTVWPFIHPDDVAHIDAEVRRWAMGAPVEPRNCGSSPPTAPSAGSGSTPSSNATAPACRQGPSTSSSTSMKKSAWSWR